MMGKNASRCHLGRRGGGRPGGGHCRLTAHQPPAALDCGNILGNDPHVESYDVDRHNVRGTTRGTRSQGPLSKATDGGSNVTMRTGSGL